MEEREEWEERRDGGAEERGVMGDVRDERGGRNGAAERCAGGFASPGLVLHQSRFPAYNSLVMQMTMMRL